MIDKFIWLVGLRYFFTKKKEKIVSIIAIFSLLGVMLGVAALIVVMSIMKGFHREFSQNIIGINGDINITCANYENSNNYIENYEDIKKKISSITFVKSVIPTITGQALAMGKKINQGVLVRGINYYDLIKNKSRLTQNIIAGDFSDFENNQNAVAIGSELAKNLNIYVGDKIKLVSASTISTIFGGLPRTKIFEVVVVFSSGLYDYDALNILMPLTLAQKFFGLQDVVNLLEINSINPEEAENFVEQIRKILPFNLEIKSWQTINMQFFNALAMERTSMFLILSLIIIVAAFNIISSLFMLIKDKSKDIAILMTIGASRMQIMGIFVLNGMIIGFMGTLFGVLLGLGFITNIEKIRKFLEKITGQKIFDAVIYFLYNLPSKMEIEDVFFISSLTILLCLIASIYPSYRASRLDPVEILRYE